MDDEKRFFFLYKIVNEVIEIVDNIVF